MLARGWYKLTIAQDNKRVLATPYYVLVSLNPSRLQIPLA